MQGFARVAANPQRAASSIDHHIQNSKLSQTLKTFHVSRHFGTISDTKYPRNARNRVGRTRAALEDPPRPSKSSPSAIHRIEAPYEVDGDLYTVLNLATDEELEDLYSSLYVTSILSPLGKSIQTPSVPSVQYSGREALIRKIEHRFRFLAADAGSTLRGTWPSYRQTLLAIHSHLNVPCPSDLATHDLEAEIFLFLLNEHADAVDAAAPASATAAEHATQGDGMGSSSSSRSTSGSSRSPNIFQRVLAPLKLGAKEVVPTLTRTLTTVAVTNLQMNAARQLGSVLLRRTIQYEAAAQVAAATAGSLANKAAVRIAQRGLTQAAARYGAARSLLSVMGPLLWAVTAVDLAKMSIGCDYARLVKAIFAIAQIRLLRTDGWATKSQLGDDGQD